ncbi:MAG: long-chain-fatty-acid--CoA ligase [Chloroflexota bacterium]
MIVPLTPLDFKRRAVRLYGAKIGVIDGDRRFTYAEFGSRCSRLANALLSIGLREGDRVAYLAYNSYPLLEAYYGVLEAGGVLAPLNIRLISAELVAILHSSGARFLFADPDFLAVVEDIEAASTTPLRVVWLGKPPAGRTEPEYDALLARSSDATVLDGVEDENAVAELFFTSGTTGSPRGVMLTHRNLYLHALGVLVSFGGVEADVQLHTIPLFHVNGWGTPQSLTAVGGTHVMMRKFDPGEALRLIQAEGVTRFYAGPTMVNAMINHPDIANFDISSLEKVILGGAPAPPDLVRRSEEVLRCHVESGYGLSETSPVISHASPKSRLSNESEQARVARAASTGLPVLGADVRVVDETGQEVAWDGEQIGEIVVRGNTVMAGYWNDLEGTAAGIRRGWLHTGDMATVDSEGYILIVDRKKDIIISGGENIASIEIENVLFQHPAVLEVAVVAVPDDRWGEAPKAIVSLRSGGTASEAELMEFCRSRLSSFKVPKSIDFLDALPKGGTGKILKRDLREPFWEGKARRVH